MKSASTAFKSLAVLIILSTAGITSVGVHAQEVDGQHFTDNAPQQMCNPLIRRC